MNSKNQKNVDKTVLTEIMRSTEEQASAVNNELNTKIQQKFNLAFSDTQKDLKSNSDASTIENLKAPQGIDKMSTSAKKMPDLDDLPALEFDVIDNLENEKHSDHSSKAKSEPTPSADNVMEFDVDNEGMDFSNDSTQKTIVVNRNDFNLSSPSNANSEVEDDSILMEDLQGPAHDGTMQTSPNELHEVSFNDEPSFSSNPISSHEEKTNIEATIKDIIRPRENEKTAEFKLDSLSSNDDTSGFDLTNDATFSNFEKTNDKNIHVLNTAMDDEDEEEAKTRIENVNREDFNLDFSTNEKTIVESSYDFKNMAKAKQTSSIDSEEFADFSDVEADLNSLSSPTKPIPKETHAHKSSSISDDEYIRLQSTIRQLREEREDLVSKIKSLKHESREFEEDNLTLKALLDETKIEVNILRKRYVQDLEDFKYRLHLSDEKRALSEERAKQLEKVKEKLEQKTRIDFNQIRQREKELESKLELMAMDVDSQIQTRDQKILELRRKIDALEFNMENASIRELKSQEDKRRLEDRLNKMMKTLRNSIKNLEDDLDTAVDNTQRAEKEK
jgi:hypothetical protein